MELYPLVCSGNTYYVLLYLDILVHSSNTYSFTFQVCFSSLVQLRKTFLLLLAKKYFPRFSLKELLVFSKLPYHVFCEVCDFLYLIMETKLCNESLKFQPKKPIISGFWRKHLFLKRTFSRLFSSFLF